jgi:PAS domain-containing protein
MALFPVFQLAGMVAASFSIAYAALWLLAHMDNRAHRKTDGFMTQPDHSIAFLFDDETLVNASDCGRHMLVAAPAGATDWVKLLTLLRPRFPDLPDQIADLAEQGNTTLLSLDGITCLQAEWRGGLARICLVDSESATPAATLDQHSLNAVEQELETLRATAQSAPFLVWRQRQDGTITWANNAYLELARLSAPDALVAAWPPPRLFDLSQSPRDRQSQSSQRMNIHLPGEAEPRWFECFETALGDETLFTAMAADKIVKAEVALRDFVQTLTKTFAHLTVGLAVFDKQRRLALFNPALTDLTSLSPEFLSARPTLRAVLDQLREKMMLPEPKDYRSWRQRLHDLETAAVNGSYKETWSLASGQTYLVTGRPHPDGAVAFLFEDISAEISLTRRFRAELEVSQAVMDSLDEAIAVFSPSGILTLSNAAYCRLWGIDQTTILGNFGIVDATQVWSEKCAPTPVWGDAREFVGAMSDRAEWTADVRLKDGRCVQCRFMPISGGATLAGFTIARPEAARIKISQSPASGLDVGASTA